MTLPEKLLTKLRNKFLQTWMVLCLDVVSSVCATGMVLLLVDLLLPGVRFERGFSISLLVVSLIVSGIIFKIGGVYKAVIRYSTLRELSRICVLCLGKEVLLWSAMALCGELPGVGLLSGFILLDYCMTISMLFIIRVAMVVVYERFNSKGRLPEQYPHLGGCKRILVYGTSDKSVATATILEDNPHYHVVGYILPSKMVNDYQLAGKNVYHCRNTEELAQIIGKTDIAGILFPDEISARAEQDRLITFCRETDLRTYIVPRIDEMGPNAAVSNYVRNIRIEDLLGREEINISMNEIIENFRGKVVMVTGAAGSIGFELCRQLATFGVKKLVLFDNAETPLHNIRLELEDRFPDLDFAPVIGDVRSEARLDYVFRAYKPQIVFHAAAYKHVPLMEENPCEAVCVNVAGSRQVADMCVKYGVEKMVMVSTDKAVNPTNIMGCTKRLAEIYVQSLGLAIERGEIKGVTKFVTTRFGNVLGSNGSVIPRFREQIEHGGPITVTHPEITRFFMTIPEACRLVMEAATFADGTQIFVFDMGKSVKIVTLAERMINLAGLEVDRDIKIEFTGLRPGEKLYEEVLATKENTLPTCHERIFIAKVREYPYNSVLQVIEHLTDLATAVCIPEMVKLMKHTVPEFKSKNSIFEKYDEPETESEADSAE
ncbi:MAG: polysaccharide biosynthesis protein [Bacteroidales bacterium]|nr:polysaccharide biosynthesis protein [Bacteroidales bacterium]MDE6802264.1 polysaccharide biosynthesis protein [Muribaculaceae bacterium]